MPWNMLFVTVKGALNMVTDDLLLIFCCQIHPGLSRVALVTLS